ncbi:MAG: hypothetical protein RR459_04500, partial [Christensenellaceae bacterium]
MAEIITNATTVAELPIAQSLVGLSVLGIDYTNTSVSVPVELLKGDGGGQGVPPYGIDGQVLIKIGSTNYVTKWANPNSLLRPLFVSRGAVWNETTGFYELNGLTDITEEQMIQIYNHSSNSSSDICNFKYQFLNTRTVYVMNATCGGNGLQAHFMFSYSGIESVVLSRVPCIHISGMFYNCTKLRIVDIRVEYLTDLKRCVDVFTNCSALTDLKLLNLLISISIADSPLLTRDSILYLINNAENTAPITVALHATALSRLTQADIALA